MSCTRRGRRWRSAPRSRAGPGGGSQGGAGAVAVDLLAGHCDGLLGWAASVAREELLVGASELTDRGLQGSVLGVDLAEQAILRLGVADRIGVRIRAVAQRRADQLARCRRGIGRGRLGRM